MEQAGLQAIKRRRARGYILECLSVYPNEFINLQLIADFIRTCGITMSDNEVSEQLNYLKDKNYIKLVQKREQTTGVTVSLAEICSGGIDLIEGNIPPDPGIVTPR